MFRFILLSLILSNFCKLSSASYAKEEASDTDTLYLGYITEFTYGRVSDLPFQVKDFSILYGSVQNSSAYKLSQYFLINNWLFQIGFEYSCITKSVNITNIAPSFVTRDVLRTDTINTHYYIIDGERYAESVVETFVDEITEFAPILEQKKLNHTISYFSVPINFGYRWRFNYLALYLKMGASIHYVNQSFEYNMQSAPLFYNELNTSNYFYSASVSTAIEVPISYRLSFILEPSYKFLKLNSTIQQSIVYRNQSSLSIGIQYWF